MSDGELQRERVTTLNMSAVDAEDDEGDAPHHTPRAIHCADDRALRAPSSEAQSHVVGGSSGRPPALRRAVFFGERARSLMRFEVRPRLSPGS